MTKIIKNFRLPVLLLSLSMLAPHTAFAVKEVKKSPQLLSASEVVDMYKDKTWRWPSGGGRFDSEGRRFTAMTEENGKKSIGEGTWSVDNLGKMCMKATWTTDGMSAKARTCFSHGRLGKVIYQKRLPKGDWYVFRSAKPRASDEFSKLVKTDSVTVQALAAKQTMSVKK
ncbi:DUF995 domain-containing protein [Agrobacterium sp.]|jgi:hypothetical protein|uniref:DUF995 domain-containing protein n=1 Tax=Agrobacterium sp. TaxID=361 RepID=UPI0028AD2D23|nr:DUF995 domain-containing protein [Agrobacterium sp.]